MSSINMDTSLGDLGIDSLMGVEIKQALERDYAVSLSMKEIRTVEFGPFNHLKCAFLFITHKYALYFS